MRRTLLATGLIAGLFVVASRPVQSQSETKQQAKAAAERKKAAAPVKSEAKAAADHSADEAAIRDRKPKPDTGMSHVGFRCVKSP